MCKEQYIYIETDSTDAAFNFALEYYLATERPFPGKTVVLIWRTAPTVMVGRFQNTFAEINRAYVEKKQIAVARRMSGGGTIYTDFGAWQYSFITFAKGKASGMRELAAPVVDILRKLGAPAEFSGRNDILIEGRKVSGTAQYRKNGCVVHHGSLLYAADLDEIVRSTNVSCEKLQAKGIQSVRQRVGNISDYLPAPLSMMEFKEALIKSFAADPSQIMTLEKTDIRRVRELAEEIFSDWEFIYGSNPLFDMERTARTEGGIATFRLSVEKGRITELHIFGDFLEDPHISWMEELLTGCRYERAALCERLSDSMGTQCFLGLSGPQLAEVLL